VLGRKWVAAEAVGRYQMAFLAPITAGHRRSGRKTWQIRGRAAGVP
jgi:hypothetical protein